MNGDDMLTRVPASKTPRRTRVAINCPYVLMNAVPSVTFTFGGKPFTVPPSLFNLGYTGSVNSNTCVGAVVGTPNFSFWIVGDVFLQTVYTAFDMGSNRVGFATLR